MHAVLLSDCAFKFRFENGSDKNGLVYINLYICNSCNLRFSIQLIFNLNQNHMVRFRKLTLGELAQTFELVGEETQRIL